MEERSFHMDDLIPLMKESLTSGQSFRFSPRGISMLPMLRQGKDTVTLSPIKEPLKKYDIPLYQRDDGAYVLHRITEVGETYTCIGDNQFEYEPGLREEQMIAVVTAFTRGKKKISVNAWHYRLYVRFWHLTRPLRWILFRAKRKMRVISRRLWNTKAKGEDVPVWKKWLLPGGALAVLIAVLVLCLAFCNKEEPAPKEEPKRIGICAYDLSDEHEKLCATELQKLLQQKQYQVEVLDAGGDQSAQNRQVKDLLNRGCDGLLLSPVMPDSVADLVLAAKEKQVPVIFYDREPAKEILQLWDRTCYVDCDPVQSGTLQGQMTLQLPDHGDINGDGKVAYMILRDDDTCNDSVLRGKYAEDTLKAGAETLPLGNHCVGVTQQKAAEAFGLYLAEYGKDIEVVLCTSDVVAMGAWQAIVDGGRTVGMDIYLIGADGDGKALQKILAGEMSGTVLCDSKMLAVKLSQLLDQILQQPLAEKRFTIDHVAVTKENASDYQS